MTAVKWTSYTTANGLINNMITYIAGDLDNNVWIGTSEGLSRFNGTTWTNYTTAEGLPNNMISYIRADKKGNIWIGTWIGGLAKFDGTSFTVFTTEDSLVDNNVTSIGIDQYCNKWVGSYYGVSLFDSLDQWVANYRATDGLYNDYVQDIDIDSKDNKWFGIYAAYIQDGALTKYDNSTWVSYTLADGLVNQLIRRIAVDRKDNIWIATGFGVSKLAAQNTGIDYNQNSSLRIYPNPVNDVLYIDQVTLPVQLAIYDITGNKLLSGDFTSFTNSLDIHTLLPGIYILKIEEGEKFNTRKLIVL